ncbi:unnamed protein product [Paramecium octaurelia]|uniref:Uncharacterized protein n=1 Tax=Paramecium octaurelia TaxID=43137 RepID=A0A8S1YMF9_PAROT|nr:unnamed protein product [Paramecium octaurelia]
MEPIKICNYNIQITFIYHLNYNRNEIMLYRHSRIQLRCLKINLILSTKIKNLLMIQLDYIQSSTQANMNWVNLKRISLNY